MIAAIAGASVVAALPVAVPVPVLDSLRAQLQDAVLVGAGGPRLGSRPPAADIVLVVMDARSARALGHADTSVAEDLGVYRRLLDAGALVVAEDRADRGHERDAELLQRADGLPGGDRLLLNTATETGDPPLPAGLAGGRATAGAAALYPPLDAAGRFRHYPLLASDGTLEETLPVAVARRLLHDPPADDVSRAADESGIAAGWLSRLPKVPAGVLSEARSHPPAPYRLDPHHAIPWSDHVAAPYAPALESPASLTVDYGAGGYAQYSYADVLAGRVGRAQVGGRAVIIGDDFGSLCGVIPTDPQACPNPAAVDAAVAQEIVDGTYPAPAPPGLTALLVVLVAAAGALAAGLLVPAAAVVAIVLAAGLLLGGAGAAYHRGIEVEVLLPLAALVLAALLGLRTPSGRSAGWRAVPPARIALLVAALVASQVFWPLPQVRAARLQAADWLLVRQGGPRLGATAADSRLVIVPDSRLETPDSDRVAEYRTLLAAGARAVVDLRPMTSDAAPLLAAVEGLPGARGRVFVDDLAPPPGTAAFVTRAAFPSDRYSTDAAGAARYYPLFWVGQDGHLVESTPLQIGRILAGDPSLADASASASTAGVLQPWADTRSMTPEERLQLIGPGDHPERPYSVDGHRQIPWVTRTPEDPDEWPAAMQVGFAASPAAYATLAVRDVDSGPQHLGSLAGKVVIVDTAAHLLSLPTEGNAQPVTAPNGRMLAAAIQQVVDGPSTVPLSDGWDLALVVVAAFAAALAAARLQPGLALGVAAATAALLVALGVVLFRLGVYPDLLSAPAALVLAAVLSGAERSAAQELERRRVQDLFGRYVPRAVVAELVRQPAEVALALGGSRRHVAVLFADVRGFTRMSHDLSPEAVVEKLNAVLERLVTCAHDERGTVDKYIGDCVMVLFNAPTIQEDPELRAVRAAWRMQRALEGLDLKVGIGINCGDAVVGTMGTADRLEYTAIGDVVNVASRLCGVAGPGEVVISEPVLQRVNGAVRCRPRPAQTVKGIDEALATYLVVGLASDRSDGDGTAERARESRR